MNHRLGPEALVLLLLAQLSSVAHAEEGVEPTPVPGRHYPVNLSLYHPVSLNDSENDSVNLNLSLAYGRVGHVSGLDVSLGASAVSHTLQGVQVCGLLGVAGESGQGVQASGLMSVSGERFAGFQAAGLMSVAGERLSGFQIAGLMNVAGDRGGGLQLAGLANVGGDAFSGGQLAGGFSVTGEGGAGFQVSGLFNVTGENRAGLQVAGLFNVTGEDLEGFQAAGLFNVAGGRLEGVQVAAFNVAGESAGLQVGVVNLAGASSGVQIGLVNHSRGENTGVPLGLVNLAPNGEVRKTLWGGNLVGVSGGARFVVGRVYSIVSLGFVNPDDGISRSVAYGFHYGITFPREPVALSTDLGYRYRDNEELFGSSDREPDQHVFEARLILEIPVSDRLWLILGGGAGHTFDSGRSFASGTTSPLVVAGLELK